MNSSKSAGKRVKAVLCTLVVVMGLGACGTKSASNATDGPTVWTSVEKQFLTQISNDGLAASNFYSEANYVQTGHVVCDSLKAGKKASDVLAVLVAAGRANGLPAPDRQAFSTAVSAAAVAYICPDQLANLTKQ